MKTPLLVALLFLSGCGGGGDTDEQPRTTETVEINATGAVLTFSASGPFPLCVEHINAAETVVTTLGDLTIVFDKSQEGSCMELMVKQGTFTWHTAGVGRVFISIPY
jgi:hypothetical protein